jgi:hypothetical protein
MRKRASQRGLTTVEFAICGAVMLILMFGVIEFGRIIFTLNVLEEGARRAARVAAVCQVSNAAITNAARFVSLPGASPSVAAEYLNLDGAVIGNPAGNYGQIRYVRVRVFGYQMPLALPFLNATFSAPEFSSTLPSESLGIPNFGAIPAC